MQLDEQALRRDDFKGGHMIRLWDGQEWQIPRPRVAWRRSQTEGKGAEPYLTLGRGFDAAVAGIDSAEKPSELASALLNLAASMLLSNYDLTDEALNAILVYDTDDRDCQETWLRLLRVARGVDPDETPAESPASAPDLATTALLPA